MARAATTSLHVRFRTTDVLRVLPLGYKQLWCEFLQGYEQPADRQTDHIVVIPVDMPHKDRSKVLLNSVGAGLIHWRTTCDIGSDLLIIELPKCNVGRFNECLLL